MKKLVSTAFIICHYMIWKRICYNSFVYLTVNKKGGKEGSVINW